MAGRGAGALAGKEGKRKMRKVVSRFGLTLLTAAFLVGSAGTASAVGVNLFHSPANDGTGGADVGILVGSFPLNLWATPSVDVFSLSPLNLAATGGITIGACTAASNALCGTFGSPALDLVGRPVGWSEPISGSLAGVPIKIATLTILNAGGPGTLDLASGVGTDFYFTDIVIDSDTILFSVPEPGTLLLLGAGLTGLLVQGRRREN